MTSIVGLATLLALACLSALAWRRHGGTFYPVLAIVAAIAAVLSLARLIQGSFVVVSALDLPLIAVTLVVGANAIGLPDPVARRLGIGFRSRAWEYDRRLARVIAGIEGAVPSGTVSLGAESSPKRSNQAVEGQPWIQDLRSLRAPDQQWQRLTSDYADAYEEWILLATTDTSQDLVALRRRISLLHGERELLRAAYRAEARSVLARSRIARLLYRAADDGGPTSSGTAP